MAQMNLIVHEQRAKERKPQGVVLHISLQEDYGGFCTQTPLKTKKGPRWIKYEVVEEKYICLIFLSGVLHLFCCDSVIKEIRTGVCRTQLQLVYTQTYVPTVIFIVHMQICNLFAFGKELLVKRQISVIFIPWLWVRMMSHQWKQKWSEALTAIAPIILDKWSSSRKASLSEL